MEYNFCNGAIQWRISNSVNVFFLTFFVFAKVRPAGTKERLTDTHRIEQDPGYRRNLADLPKNRYGYDGILSTTDRY